jgi:hypothetical protein
MFYVGEWPWEIKDCILDVLKNNFVEVYEAVFQSVQMPFQIIFYVLNVEKSDFYEVALSDVFKSRMALRAHILPSGRLNKRLV